MCLLWHATNAVCPPLLSPAFPLTHVQAQAQAQAQQNPPCSNSIDIFRNGSDELQTQIVRRKQSRGEMVQVVLQFCCAYNTRIGRCMFRTAMWDSVSGKGKYCVPVSRRKLPMCELKVLVWERPITRCFIGVLATFGIQNLYPMLRRSKIQYSRCLFQNPSWQRQQQHGLCLCDVRKEKKMKEE